MLDTKSSQKNERKPSLINSRSFAEHLSFFKHFMASTSQPSRMFSTHATYSAYNTCMYTEHLHHYDDYVCLLFTFTTCTEGISYRDNIIYLAIVGMDTHAHGAVGGLYAAHPNENCSFPSTFPPQGTMEKGEGSRSVKCCNLLLRIHQRTEMQKPNKVVLEVCSSLGSTSYI